MPGYADTGALGGLGQVSDREMQAMQSAQPKYTPESLQMMMQQPEMISIMEEMSANSGVPMEDVIRYLPELPQDTLEMIMNDVFEKMKK